MKNCAGFDIGNHALHIAVKKNDKIVRSIVERLAEGMVQNGRITSLDAMSDAIKEVRKTQKIRVRNASVVLPAGLCYCRRFTVTAMSKEQLIFNLPYEFHDFITDDKRNYFFDYAVVDIIRNEDGTPKEYDLIGAATRKDVIADYSRMFAKAGFKLKAAIPEELAYVNVLRAHGGDPHRHGILDIGHNAVRLFMFTGDRFESVRVIDYGCNALDVVISEKFGVDDHYLSATYRESNYENSTELPGCLEIYNAMAIEVLKAVNFYRFNGGGRLEHLHCCGGGVKIKALIDMLRRLPIEITDLSEFIPQPTVTDGSAAEEPVAETNGTSMNEENAEEETSAPSEENVSEENPEEPSEENPEEPSEENPEEPSEENPEEPSEENPEEPSEENPEEPSEENPEEPSEENPEEPSEENPEEPSEENPEEPSEENPEEPSEENPEESSEENPEENAGEGSETESAPEEVSEEETLKTPEEATSGEGTAESAPSAAPVSEKGKSGKETEPVDYALVIAAAGAALQ